MFESVKDQHKELPLPVAWIWGIIDEFIYQFQMACKWRKSVKAEEDEKFRELMNEHDENIDFWNLEEVLNILNDLLIKSKVLVNDKVEDYGQNSKTIHYFGYFVPVGLLRVYVMIGDF